MPRQRKLDCKRHGERPASEFYQYEGRSPIHKPCEAERQKAKRAKKKAKPAKTRS